MHFARRGPIFENRYDAGRQLAAKLTEYKSESVVVLGIPNGGVAVALEVAIALEADLDLVISRKIPLPLRPEAGFGAVADDGTVILNDEVVEKAGLSPQQINYQVSQVRADIRQRSLLYHKDRPLSVVDPVKADLDLSRADQPGATLSRCSLVWDCHWASVRAMGLRLTDQSSERRVASTRWISRSRWTGVAGRRWRRTKARRMGR